MTRGFTITCNECGKSFVYYDSGDSCTSVSDNGITLYVTVYETAELACSCGNEVT